MKKFLHNYAKYCYLIFSWFVIITVSSGESFAQRWVTYSTPHGLADGAVRDILVDQKGELWFATDNGVSRFNGEWFTYRTEEGLVNNRVTSMALDLDGNIWFGTEGGISKIVPTSDLNNPANWHNYTVSNTGGGLANDYVTAIIIDKEGNLWFGTKGGGISVADPTPDFAHLSRDPLLDPENWKTYTKEDGLTSGNIFQTSRPLDQLMALDAIGNIWVIAGLTSPAINVYDIENRIWKTFCMQPPGIGLPRTIFTDRDGNVWIGTKGSGVYKVYPNNLTCYDEHYTTSNTGEGLADNTIIAIAQDSAGAMWFGHERAGKGTSMAAAESDLTEANNWQQFTTLDGLGHFFIGAITEDEENNIWFGHSEDRGVSQLDRSWLSPPFLLQKDIETKVLFPDNRRFLWIRVDGGVARVSLDANLLLDSSVSNVFIDSTSGLNSSPVIAGFQDSRDYFWFGTNKGVDRVSIDSLNNPDPWPSFDSSNGFGFNRVTWITEDNLNYVWLATYLNNEPRVYRVPVGSPQNSNNWLLITEDSGLISANVREILPAQNGQLWFATDSGVSVFDPALDPTETENWQNFTTEDGLVHNSVESIFEDMEANIWFATRGGVSRLDPRTSNWTNYTVGNTNNGLVNNHVTSITQFNDNEFWFGTLIGANKFELNTNRWTLYTTSDGLKANHIVSLFTDTINKEIWFGTFGGGTSRYKPKTRPPETFLDTNRDIETENHITFDFHGADIITPEEELRFFYKLDNDAWIETSDRFAPLFVEDSDKPERHVFQVRAIDRDGNIDRSPATDVFYKMNSDFGGNIVIVDTMDTSSIRLYIPPGQLEQLRDSITVSRASMIEPSDSLIIVAYEINPSNFIFERPASLAISFLNTDGYVQDQLAIFRQNENESWDSVGGTVEIEADTVTITTAITQLGTYAVRKERLPAAPRKDEVNIQPRIFSPRGGGRGFGEQVNISFTLGKSSPVTVKIYNLAGRLKRTLMSRQSMSPGTNVVLWDGKDDNGNICPSGLHIVVVQYEGKARTKPVMVSNQFN